MLRRPVRYAWAGASASFDAFHKQAGGRYRGGPDLRGSPRVADPLTAWPDGTRLEIVGADAQGDGLTWKQVRDPCGQLGWLPARYAAPTSAP